MSNILGVSAGFHDAALSVVNPDGDILFASHSERFSGKKHDKDLCDEIIYEALRYGQIDTISYYERPWLKNLRAVRAGQPIAKQPWTVRGVLSKQMKWPELLKGKTIRSCNHHLAHAAGGFQTSPFNDATVVVIDAIGEFDTISIWNAWYDEKGNAKYKLRYSLKYPHSIGLFYSAMTKRCGLRPLDEEYILMGMAAYGNANNVAKDILNAYVHSVNPPTFSENLHIGIPNEFLPDANVFDLAAGTQQIAESLIDLIIANSKHYTESGNLVYSGGVALNCLANRRLGLHYNNIWIMPNPGDAGSSLGAAALAYKKKLNWQTAFLGYDMPGEYPVKEIIDELVTNKIVGVASGRAEFGPRALGNRSLLADPRGADIKNKVNEIKMRQKFRPFAPVILEEHVKDYFRMPNGFEKSPYMQITAPCKRPEEFPAIIHADGTSRVQTVPDDGSGIRKLLEMWKVYSGCPMLLNTSLNIRGKPMVNNYKDALAFQKKYGVKVCVSV
jgi:carbamoyltransferase